MSRVRVTRREALGSAGALVVGARSARTQSPGEATVPQAPRLTPLDEIVNSLEFGEQAKLVLPERVFSTIAGSDRSAFNRLTFRPRMNVPTLDMDLSVNLFGDTLFTPIVVGPISDQRWFHPDGELATAAGASAAKAAMIVSSHAGAPFEQIVAKATVPLWYAVYADADAVEQARAAATAGAKAIFVTVGAAYRGTDGTAVPAQRSPEIDWTLVEAIAGSVDVPVVLKGVTSPDDARMALDRGLRGIVVSNFGGLLGGSQTAPIDALLAIADTVGAQVPILVDGSFRRATDILDALIIGARGVLLARPIMWALAAYGADGVQSVLQMLQSDLARCFAMLGASNLGALTRRHITIHTR